MFGYYLQLAMRSLKRNKALTVLMIITIGVGIGAAMTTLTVFRVLSGNPIPQKSDVLFHVQLDPMPANARRAADGEPHTLISRFDGENLLREARGKRQTLTGHGGAKLEPEGGGDALSPSVRFATADFFPMFLVPMQYGQAWTAADDASRVRVVLLSRRFNDKLFGGANSVGRTIRLDGTPMRVIGVIDTWKPTPRFYDETRSVFGNDESVFMPFSTSRELNIARHGNMDCWSMRDPGMRDTDLNAKCVWLKYWVELESPAQASDYLAYLNRYSEQQKTAGRFERPANARLRNVMQWLDHTKAVPSDVTLQLWLAFGFLLTCLINVIGLLLAKFLRRSGDIGVRRALGASRRQIFLQLMTEAGVIGLAGGALGLLLAYLGLWGVRHQPVDYADLARLNLPMLLLTFVLAILATLIAGALPAWRAMRITPAIQLKTQ